MNRLKTALLTLGVSVAIATTAAAQNWWVGCNPDAPMCRLQTGSDPPWAPGSVAPTLHGSMYMYTPRHGTLRIRRRRANLM